MFSDRSELYRRQNGGRKEIPHPKDKKENHYFADEAEKENKPARVSKQIDSSPLSFASKTFHHTATNYVLTAINGAMPSILIPLMIVAPFIIPTAEAFTFKNFRLGNKADNLTMDHHEGIPPRHAKSLCKTEGDFSNSKEIFVKINTWKTKATFVPVTCDEGFTEIAGKDIPANANIHYSIKKMQSMLLGTSESSFFAELCFDKKMINECVEYSIEDAKDIVPTASCESYRQVGNHLIEATVKNLPEEACNDFTNCFNKNMDQCLTDQVAPALQNQYNQRIDFLLNKALPGALLVAAAGGAIYCVKEYPEESKQRLNQVKETVSNTFSAIKNKSSEVAGQAKRYMGQFFSAQPRNLGPNEIHFNADSNFISIPMVSLAKKQP